MWGDFMVVFGISKKMLIIILSIVLLVSIGFNILGYVHNLELSNKYNSLIRSINQSERTNLVAFLASANIQAKEEANIEIFDIGKGAVIKKVNSTPRIRSEAEKYLKEITGMYVRIKAFPDKGYIIRIPLEPSVMVQNQWLNQIVKEVFVIFPEEGAPYLLVLDEKERPLFYTFKGNTDELLKSIEFKPE